MKKIILLSLCFLFSSSCAIQGEVYRLQNRVKNWHAILNPEEKILFVQKNFIELGVILDQKELTDKSFTQKLRKIRIDEAIMSFNGQQTSYFFYHVLLKDLVKFSYKEFMDILSPEEKKDFINKKDIGETLKNSGIKSVLQKAKNTYGLQDFNDEEILNYYRTTSFSAVAYPIVYEVLAFLARYRSMEDFLVGNMAIPLDAFNTLDKLLQSRRIPTRKQAEKDAETWESLKERVFLEDLSNEDFLVLVATVFIPEMDPEVQLTTINNVRNRFKEQ